MGLVGGLLRRSLENPEVPLTSDSLAEWVGGGQTTAGVHVGEGRAYGLTAYLRAITLIAGTNAALPLKVYANGTRQRVTASVLDNPNPAQTPFEFWQTLYAHALGWGTGYARKVRNGADVVVEAWPIHPSKVRPELVDRTEMNPAGKLFIVTDRRGRESRWTPWEVMQLPYLSIDGLAGLSALQAARTALGIAVAAEDTAARFYKNGARISGVLQSKKALTKDQANRLKSQWRAKNAGVDNVGEVAVLDNETEFKQTMINPADAQVLESRKFSVTEIARMFGIPPHMLGDVTGSTSWGTGIEAQTTGFVVFTDRPWLTMVEQRVTRELLPGGWTASSAYAEYALEGLLRGDSKTRADFYRVLINNGIISPNEARAFENLAAVDGLDIYMVPKAMDRVGPGADIDSGTLGPLDQATFLQRLYLAVGKVLSTEEARDLAISVGIDIEAGPLPIGGA